MSNVGLEDRMAALERRMARLESVHDPVYDTAVEQQAGVISETPEYAEYAWGEREPYYPYIDPQPIIQIDPYMIKRAIGLDERGCKIYEYAVDTEGGLIASAQSLADQSARKAKRDSV